MKALSLDLRERILSTYDKEKGTREQVAQRFRVSLPAIGFPLIHNSEFIRDFGYFYPDFDCQAGGNALVQAFETHDKNLGNYKAKATALLKTLDIQSPENIAVYSNELISLL